LKKYLVKKKKLYKKNLWKVTKKRRKRMKKINKIFGNKSEDDVHDHVDKDHANKEKEKDV